MDVDKDVVLVGITAANVVNTYVHAKWYPRVKFVIIVLWCMIAMC